VEGAGVDDALEVGSDASAPFREGSGPYSGGAVEDVDAGLVEAVRLATRAGRFEVADVLARELRRRGSRRGAP
jgi:hypothetical protein